jgi:hypothetical protein
MAFAQLSFRESLRDIEDCLAARSDQLYHPNRSIPTPVFAAITSDDCSRLTNHKVGGVGAGPGFDGWLFPGEPRRRR